jgi:hypothetical protein
MCGLGGGGGGGGGTGLGFGKPGLGLLGIEFSPRKWTEVISNPVDEIRQLQEHCYYY